MAKRKRIEDRMLLAIGEKIVGKRATYVIEKHIGQGAFAAVYSAKDTAPNPNRYAVKEYFQGRPSERERLKGLFKREQMVSAEAGLHPLVPEFIEALTIDGYHYIVTEFIEGASLDDIIIKNYPLPREWILRWSVSLCDVLAFLHSREILHFDLKPANIRIDKHGRLKLFDFGSSLFFGERGKKEIDLDSFGTDGYLAPELATRGLSVADPRTDIFALGCIMFEMLAGDSPDQEQLNRKSVYVTNVLIHKPHSDLALIGFINKALSYNTDYRYGETRMLLEEMARIGPPLLLVDARTLRFGQVKAGQTIAPQRLRPYNVGGGALKVSVKSTAPWLSVKAVSSNEKHPAVVVQPILNKITEFNKRLTAYVEFSFKDILDEEGKVIASGDRWRIPCTMTVMPRQGSVLIPGQVSGQFLPIWISGAQGRPAQGKFEVHNCGTEAVRVFVARNLASEPPPRAERLKQIVVQPESFSLEPGKTETVTLSCAKTDSNLGDYKAGLEIRTSEGYKFTVPIGVRMSGRQEEAVSSASLPIELELPGPAVEADLRAQKEAKLSDRTISANGQSVVEEPQNMESEGGLRPLGSLYSD